MVFNTISIEKLRSSIEIAYKGDEDLLEKYHVAVFSFDEAVNSTLGMIKETSKEIIILSYSVCMNDGKEIGYVSLAKNNLYSFGVNIEYRTKEVLKDFWDKINEVMNEGFICTLYPNNTRAINWLKCCGMVQSETITLIKT